MSEQGVCSSDTCTCVNSGTLSAPHVNLPSFRPRGSLARALYEKQIADDYLSNFDKEEWYRCDLTVLPEELSSKFVQLTLDEETKSFLQRSEEKSDWILTQLWHSIVKTILSFFMTQTSINGWLQRGSMFVVSHPQFLTLMGEENGWKASTLLDLGAGDGEVTAYLAKSFDKVYVTEVSSTMQSLLRRKGFEILTVEKWHQNRTYDVISCMNLLDRCDTPLEVLSQIKKSLAPDGRVLLALVLPFSSYVESGSPDHKPKEKLAIKGSTFEEQVKSLVEAVLVPQGFEVVSWSRVPYLCEGDLRQSFYWLDDVILVLKHI